MEFNWNRILTGTMAVVGIWIAIAGGIEENLLAWLFGGLLFSIAWSARA